LDKYLDLQPVVDSKKPDPIPTVLYQFKDLTVGDKRLGDYLGKGGEPESIENKKNKEESSGK
jgi:hypothetical protein